MKVTHAHCHRNPRSVVKRQPSSPPHMGGAISPLRVVNGLVVSLALIAWFPVCKSISPGISIDSTNPWSLWHSPFQEHHFSRYGLNSPTGSPPLLLVPAHPLISNSWIQGFSSTPFGSRSSTSFPEFTAQSILSFSRSSQPLCCLHSTCLSLSQLKSFPSDP